jgi:hypothetical protein
MGMTSNLTISRNFNKLIAMSEWVEFLVTYDETEVQIIKNILEGEGIKVVVDSLKVRPYPVSVGKIGEIRLLVEKDRLTEAKRIIEIMEEPENKDT